MVGFSVGVDGIELAMIYCKALIYRSCSSLIENGDNRNGVFNALDRSSIMRRGALVEGKTGTGQLCGNNLIVFATHSNRCLGYINCVELLVIWGRAKVTVLQSMLGKVELVTWTLKNKDFGSGRNKRGFIKTEGSV